MSERGDTPRTDSESSKNDGTPSTRVSADFARQLERELSDCQKLLESTQLSVTEYAHRAVTAERDANAAMIYGKTAMAHGFGNAPPWSELHDDTKQLYREKAARLYRGDEAMP